MNHANRKNRVSTLKKMLNKAVADNGIVYIPAFSLGRTQELIYELDRIETKIPVFLDSPLGLKITKIYSELDEFWDKEAKDLKSTGNHPIDFKNLYAAKKYKDHQKKYDLYMERPTPATLLLKHLNEIIFTHVQTFDLTPYS